MPILRVARVTFNPANGLNVTGIPMLAVANDPQLKVERDKAGVEHTQNYAAGLLPESQLSCARALPTGTQPGTTIAFNKGLGGNNGDPITRSARVCAAHAAEPGVNLNLMRSEWQAIASARTQFDRVYFERRPVARLKRETDDSKGGFIWQIEKGKAHRLDVKVVAPDGRSIGVEDAIGPNAPVITLGSCEVSAGDEGKAHVKEGRDAVIVTQNASFQPASALFLLASPCLPGVLRCAEYRERHRRRRSATKKPSSESGPSSTRSAGGRILDDAA